MRVMQKLHAAVSKWGGCHASDGCSKMEKQGPQHPQPPVFSVSLTPLLVPIAAMNHGMHWLHLSVQRGWAHDQLAH